MVEREGVHFTIANLPATQWVTRQPLPCGMVTRPWKLEPAVGSHQEDSLQNGGNAQMPYEKCQQMRQPLAERADRDHLVPKAIGQQSDSTLVSRKADRRNRETFVSTRAWWHEHVYDTTTESVLACEKCQIKQNLSLDGRAARLIDRVRSEGFDALMTPIGKRRRDPSVMNTRGSIRREPRGCCLMLEDPIGERPDSEIKTLESRDGHAKERGEPSMEITCVRFLRRSCSNFLGGPHVRRLGRAGSGCPWKYSPNQIRNCLTRQSTSTSWGIGLPSWMRNTTWTRTRGPVARENLSRHTFREDTQRMRSIGWASVVRSCPRRWEGARSSQHLVDTGRAHLEDTHTAQTALVFLHHQLVFQSNIGQVKTLAFLFCLCTSGLCFVSRAQTFLDSVGVVLSPCVLWRQYPQRKVVVCPCHTQTLRTSLTPWFFVVTEDMHLSQVMSPSEIQLLEEI